MATITPDWTGGASYFDASGQSQIVDPSQPSWWDLFWAGVGATSPVTGIPAQGISDAGDALASGASEAYDAAGNAITSVASSVSSIGKWLLVALALVAVILIFWKV